MNGSAGSSRQKKQKQELTGSNGAVPASRTESGDPVVGLAVRIAEIIAIRSTFANGFANEPRSTAWHGALQAGIIA